MFSDVRYPAVASYPESGKLGAYTGEREQDSIARRADAVAPCDGEV